MPAAQSDCFVVLINKPWVLHPCSKQQRAQAGPTAASIAQSSSSQLFVNRVQHAASGDEGPAGQHFKRFNP